MFNQRRIFVLLFLLVFSFLDLVLAGQLVVRFRPGEVELPTGEVSAKTAMVRVKSRRVRALNEKYRVVRMEKLYQEALKIRPDWTHLKDHYRIILPPEEESQKAAASYRREKEVLAADPDGPIRAFAIVPNDLYYSQQWHLAKIAAPQGWMRTTGTVEAIAAVLDTGIKKTHEDFAGKIDLTNARNFVPVHSSSWTPSGAPYGGQSDYEDDYGHGTAVSGVLGAVTNNVKGVAGVDWGTKILPLKVLNDQGEGFMSYVNEALAYVAALKSLGTNIVVVNMSLGDDKFDSTLATRCIEVANQGVVLVAAAGNENTSTNTYPAALTTVVAVAATDEDDKRSVWDSSKASNFGNWVDVSAPGSNIMTTNMNGGYSGGWKGTSLASPIVAGLASLVKAANPAFSRSEVIARIKETADNIDALNPGYAGKLGTGRVNAYKALSALTARITTPSAESYLRGTVSISGSATGWNFSGYTLEVEKVGGAATVLASSSEPVEDGDLATWNTTAFNGEYLLRLNVYSNDTVSTSESITVYVNNVSPEAVLTSPVAGTTIEGKVTVSGTAKGDFFDRYSLTYAPQSDPADWQTILTAYVPIDGGVLGSWETAGLSGTYHLKLTVYDLAGNVSVSSEVVHLSGGVAPTKEVAPIVGLPPVFALPNPFDRNLASETTFYYQLAGNFNTTIYLFDLNGGLLWRRNFVAGENGAKAGINDPVWDGTALSGGRVANGVYFFQVVADGRVIGKGKVIVLN